MSLADDFLTAVTGTSFDYSGIFLPPGFLWENGVAQSRTTYARLFSKLCLSTTGTLTSSSNVITGVAFDLTTLDHSANGWPLSGPGIPAGTTVSSFTSTSITMSLPATASGSTVAIVLAPHGIGDGSTTFNVPDSRGRVTAGRDNMGGAAASRITTAGGGVNGLILGAAAGVETHTLTTAQMPTHNHGVTDPGHNHGISDTTINVAGGAGGNRAAASRVGALSTSETTGISTNTNGSGNAHPNVQPTIIKHKIIKT